MRSYASVVVACVNAEGLPSRKSARPKPLDPLVTCPLKVNGPEALRPEVPFK
jgi:hypothetical protein